MSKYAQFFSIINKLGLTKEQAVSTFTNGRTESLRSLSDSEFKKLMVQLSVYNPVPPGDAMRKKMIAIAKSMQWATDADKIVVMLDNWCLKQKFKKRLMSHSPAELSIVLTIFESKVYPDYLNALNK